jgi:hypothetical protein
MQYVSLVVVFCVATGELYVACYLYPTYHCVSLKYPYLLNSPRKAIADGSGGIQS